MLIILNHKMNLNIKEIKEYEKSLRNYNIVIMPQTLYMSLFTEGEYILGSQCISEYTATGGVSVEALVHLGVKYVLVGHYERRSIKRDTNEVIIKKIVECLKNNIIPILCIGDEDVKENESLKQQINIVFNNVKEGLDKIIIAYEPIQNIGTDSFLNFKIIEEKIFFIHQYVKEKFFLTKDILYGGSVNSKNIKNLKNINHLKGVILGSASLNIKEVIDIYNEVTLKK
ncbi:MAG: triose-phosphate isomerase [Bacilli bacterium]|nr:triose-phosphate isomerase [Bacilli bacterium]